jgi:hypothetical protein
MTATDLDQQLAELQSAADAYAARHEFIPYLTWPEGVRIAVNFTCDFDAMLLRRLLNEPPMQLAKGEFGGLAAHRAVRCARRQSDDLHTWANLRTLPSGTARGRQERPRDRRSYVGAPGAQGAGARRGSFGQNPSPRSNGSRRTRQADLVGGRV